MDSGIFILEHAFLSPLLRLARMAFYKSGEILSMALLLVICPF